MLVLFLNDTILYFFKLNLSILVSATIEIEHIKVAKMPELNPSVALNMVSVNEKSKGSLLDRNVRLSRSCSHYDDIHFIMIL